MPLPASPRTLPASYQPAAWVLLGLALALVASACSSTFEVIAPPQGEEARWGLDPTALPEDDKTLPILVNEVGCASGLPADGRIRDKVQYTEDAIIITIYVTPPPGDAQACPSNPNTPWVVHLDEPVNGRELLNGATSEIARRPIEFVGDGPGLGEVPDGADSGISVQIAGSAGVTEQHLFLVESLHARAQDAAELQDMGDLSLHPDGVELILGDSGVSRIVKASELQSPEAWELDTDEGYEGYAGPFSALEVLKGRSSLVVAIGDHDHCASPPRSAPVHLADFTLVGITPGDATSCLEWFAVDLFLDDDGHVRAIILDLYGP